MSVTWRYHVPCRSQQWAMDSICLGHPCRWLFAAFYGATSHHPRPWNVKIYYFTSPFDFNLNYILLTHQSNIITSFIKVYSFLCFKFISAGFIVHWTQQFGIPAIFEDGFVYYVSGFYIYLCYHRDIKSSSRWIWPILQSRLCQCVSIMFWHLDRTLREEASQINVNLQQVLPAAKLSAVCTVYKQW